MSELQKFEKDVLERSRSVPVLVDFWAPWCAPCRALGPVLERMAAQAAGRWELVKVNTEEQPELAAAMSISSIPAVKLFVNGDVVDQFVGALPEREIRKFLDKALPSPNAKDLAAAEQVLARGNPLAAAELLEPIVSQEPGNTPARVLLAQALLGVAPQRVEALLSTVSADSDLADKARALRTLARVAQAPDHPAALPSHTVRDQYLQGAAAVRSGDYAVALEALIAVVSRNKEYGEAKDACRAIFLLLGLRHPITDRFMRSFSSALHA